MNEDTDIRPSTAEFKPFARYFPAIDAMLFVREDVSYRAEMIDEQYLTLLWHPWEPRLVGVKLCSMHEVYDLLKSVVPWDIGTFEEYMRFYEAGLLAGRGDEMLAYHADKVCPALPKA